MKTADAIESYLAHMAERGIAPSSIRTLGHALRTVLAPVLGDPIKSLAASGVGEQLRTALGKRTSSRSRRPYTPTTMELYTTATRSMLTWAVSKHMLRLSPLDQPSLGTLIRELREAARLTRSELEDQTSVSATAIRALEYDRHRVSRTIYERLLRSPALATLPAKAKSHGIPLPVDDPNPGSGADNDPSSHSGSGGVGSP